MAMIISIITNKLMMILKYKPNNNGFNIYIQIYNLNIVNPIHSVNVIFLFKFFICIYLDNSSTG